MKRLNQLILAALAVVLTACSGGAPTTQNPNTTDPTVAGYGGPAPASADVQAFKINLWDNIKGANRCGNCHKEGGQSPMFARGDDVNLAYNDALQIVNRVNMLTKPRPVYYRSTWVRSDYGGILFSVVRLVQMAMA